MTDRIDNISHPAPPRALFLLYAISGFLSLGYQVIWFRIFIDWFGSTTLTFALVVCNFIGGLGLGALLSRKVELWLRRRFLIDDALRAYGWVEIVVGLTVGLTIVLQVIPGGLWGDFPYQLDQNGFYTPQFAMLAFQIGLAVACVLIPCVFMGVTFPLLCHAFPRETSGNRFPSALYAWNTLGACTGVLAAQFFLIPLIGHGDAFWLLALFNIALGVYFVLQGGAPKAASALQPAEAVPSENVGGDRPAGLALGVLVGCAGVSGFVAGALEGDLFKRIEFLMGSNPGATMSFISFWAILAIFLASSAVNRFRWWSLLLVQIAFAIAVTYYYQVSQVPVLDSLKAWVGSTVFPVTVPADLPFFFSGSTNFPHNLTQLLVFVGIVTFPPFFLVSLLLPYVCNRGHEDGKHLGLAYGINTLAFCAGLVLFTLVAPRVNIFFSTKYFLIVFAIATGYFFLYRENVPWRAWQAAVALVLCIGSGFVISRDFDASYFHPNSPSANWEIGALKSDGNNTTYTAAYSGFKELFFGRLSMTGTNSRAQAYMRLMAHFPLMAQDSPRKALLICFGVGNTASAIASHESIEHIDAVDLNKNIFLTAPEFERWNRGVYADERVRLINDDGRHFLRVTREKYDLITSEPPPPMAAGVYRLYSREYYEDALQHLTPTGMMSQWIPIYQMPPEAVALAIHTFAEVFPHALLFSGWGNDFIIVGSPSPIDLGLIEKNFAVVPQATRESLAQASVTNPISMLTRIIDSRSGILERYAMPRSISDQHNDLEHFFLQPAPRKGLAYSPEDVIRDLGVGRLAAGSVLEEIMHHLGRLRFHARGFPFESMANIVNEGNRPIAPAGVDWVSVRKKFDAAIQAYSRRENPAAIRLLRDALELAPEQPDILLNLGRLQFVEKDYRGAADSFRRFVALETDSVQGHLFLGSAYKNGGQAVLALDAYATASELQPKSPIPLTERAWILATHPNEAIRKPDQAVALAREALALSSNSSAAAINALATAYASKGDFGRAVETLRQALDGNAVFSETERDTLNSNLVRFSSREPVVEKAL